VSDVVATEAAPAADNSMPVDGPVQLGGTVDDIRDALGFDQIEDLAPDERAAPADEVAAKRTEKAKPVDTSKEDEIADVKAIEARGKARRAAKAAARREREAAVAKAAQAKPDAPAAPAAKPVEAAPARAATPVETAVKDVLAMIGKLAGDDAEAAAAAGDKPAPDTDERKAALAAVNARLDEIKASLEKTTEGAKKLEEMQAQLKALESDRVIRRHALQAIDKVADELPTLTDAKAIRAFNKEHGTTYADAAEMIGDAAERYFEKFKRTPDFAELAKRIERKLSGNTAPEKTAEKPNPKSKTVSRNDSSPPAARTGPDERTFEEAMEDFNRRFG